MATTIKCNKCGNEIEISEAIRSELEAKVIKETEAKHQNEIHLLLEKQKQIEQKQQIQLAEVKLEISKTAKQEALEQVKKEYAAKIDSAKEAAEERDKQNLEQQQEISDLLKQLRESKNTESTLKIQYEKKLFAEEDKIKQLARKDAEEALNMKIAQKDKQLSDLQKQLQDAQRKAEQGSQQLQGEVQELALEAQLKQAFLFDEISEVPKGINGADVIQIVKSNFGIASGTIVWESKNTKTWSQSWVTKLKEDTRTLKADISVLITAVLPSGIKTFGQIDGVWVTDMSHAIPLAHALRERIIAVKSIQEANLGKATKAEVVYNYLTSNDFKQRIEVWIEYFKSRKEELDKERAYFMKKWEKEDKNIMKVLQNTAGMYGDLQGLIGTALPRVQYLELTEGE
ncbi:MAG: DUF2130 domain-containing protein [bacterium]